MPTVTQQISNTNAHKSIHMLETLQKVSGGKFNFERAYDFNTKLTEAVRKNSNIAEAIKVAGKAKDRGAQKFIKRMDAAYNTVINTNRTNQKLLQNYLDTGTSKILEDVSNGTLINIKNQLIKNGMDKKQTEEVLY